MTRYKVVLLALLGAAGCRMCASPYDYCGPVVDSCCCDSQYGAGYAPQGYQSGPVYDEGYVEETAPMVQEAPMSYRRGTPTMARPRSF